MSIMKKVSAFLGAVLFIVAGSFFSQNTAMKSAGPYGNLLASSLFVKDAQASGHWDCGLCNEATCEHDSSIAQFQCRQYSTNPNECHVREVSDDICSG
ncbi:MAG: hypothetical protein F4X51_05485 [Gemmatimonadetes bacterium]|nr:hypothetical protein [Gemmatimonadota bacterium]MYD63861.1 hypothetical protein [Gemmatimonadota bacterium]